MHEMAQRWNSGIVVASYTPCTKEKRKRHTRGWRDVGCSKLTRTWLFSSDSSRTASLSAFLSLSRRALNVCLPLSFSFSLYTAYRDTCERIETRKQRVVACAGCWKKRSEISTEGGAAVMYIQGMKRIAGVVVKKRRLCGEPAKGRNEPSLAARQDRPAYCVFWDWFERGNLKREGQHLLIPLLRFPLTDDVY